MTSPLWNELNPPSPCSRHACVWQPVSTQHRCSHICLGIWYVQGPPSWAKTSLHWIRVFILLLFLNLLVNCGNLVIWRHWKGLSKWSIRLAQPAKTELKSNSPCQSSSATRNPGLLSPHCRLHIVKALSLHMLISHEPYSDPVQCRNDQGPEWEVVCGQSLLPRKRRLSWSELHSETCVQS